MAYATAPAHVFVSRRGNPSLPTTFSVFVVSIIAAGTGAWIGHTDPMASDSIPASKNTSSFFDVRFPSETEVSRTALTSRLLFQRSRAELEIKFQLAKGRLAEQLRSISSQSAAPGEPPSMAAAVPVPKSRPVEAALASQSGSAHAEERSLLQKISDLF